jgi:hypothetical protein
MDIITAILRAFNLLPAGTTINNERSRSKRNNSRDPEYMKVYRKNGRRIRVICSNDIKLMEGDR